MRTISILFLSLFLMMWAGCNLSALAEDYTRYLFVYFPSNQNEHIYYAVSDNGYDYTPLRDGARIISADTISIKHGVRDPHILRGEDGWFYMVLTDMRSAEGWDSNRGLVMMKSQDLVNWTHSTVHFPDKYKDKIFEKVTRVWAPETIYDPVAGKYMVYFSLLTNDGSIPYDKVFYCYANEDFTDLEGDPIHFFDRGKSTIDMDIVYNENDGLYHGFYKNEGDGGICQVTAQTLTAPAGQEPGSQWSSPSGALQQTTEAVEGAGVFQLIDGETWVLMYDCYMNGHYQFCTSTDLNTFTFKQNTETSGMFTPRHGTVIPITDAELNTIDPDYIRKQEEARLQELQQLKDQLTEEAARAQLMGVDITDIEAFLQQEDIAKEDLQAQLQALNVSQFNALAANYNEDKSNLITNNWQLNNQRSDMKGQHWDGTGTSTYYEQNNGWGSNAWEMSMTQNLSLPAGYYVLKASGRSASDAVEATMSVDDQSVRFPTKADVGYGIATDGTASFDASKTYANGGVGRGWEWRYIPFHLEEDATVTIKLAGSVKGAVHQWMSISNVSLSYSTTNPASVKTPATNDGKGITEVFSVSGQQLSQPQHGLNIVKRKGNTEKVMLR